MVIKTILVGVILSLVCFPAQGAPEAAEPESSFHLSTAVEKEIELRILQRERSRCFRSSLAIGAGTLGTGALGMGIAGFFGATPTLEEASLGLTLTGVFSITGMGLSLSNSERIQRWGGASLGLGAIAMGATMLASDFRSGGHPKERAQKEHRHHRMKSTGRYFIGLGFTLALGNLFPRATLDEVRSRLDKGGSSEDSSEATAFGLAYLKRDLTRRNLILGLSGTVLLMHGINELYIAHEYTDKLDTVNEYIYGASTLVTGGVLLVTSFFGRDLFRFVDTERVKLNWSLAPSSNGVTLALAGRF